YLHFLFFFFFYSRRRHTRSKRDWSSDVCSSDLVIVVEKLSCTVTRLQTLCAMLSMRQNAVVQFNKNITKNIILRRRRLTRKFMMSSALQLKMMRQTSNNKLKYLRK